MSALLIRKALLNGGEMIKSLELPRLIDKKYLESNPEAKITLLPEVFRHLSQLSGYYPSFDEWLEKKVLPGLISGERSVILEYRNSGLSGLAIVKNDEIEQKLCCLRVLPLYQGTGVGLKLFERSFEVLNNSSPLLSVAEEQLVKFHKIFKYYGFEIAKIYPDYYRPLKDELSFNGLIEQSSTSLSGALNNNLKLKA
ncbi:GNAT family N-acetyltransferase [Pseudomonas chlororaphis]|uniref:GNAT family N-acetyltransferase n=1 Tax=Pseudomonas chlororaphis TaxID=587753 RepID=A0AAP9W008_9PSED|nr:GNAT family N-acetyltransferase [Pseudomonas chlororaphis]AUG38629.1 GNAT family N-acetyltransferase [Pseudomonas chlororaphis]QNR48233.1 GNAT family N-acetyltransferase [Pseudomonas chlororaphis]